jgi:hypothetical protein
MLTHGADRARQAGDKVILHSAIAKGWTPRTPKTLTNSEHPGTAVLWDEQYYEVIEATALPTGGVRYVLMQWREDHTIRTFESYDAQSEELRIADHERVRRQRRAGFLTNLSGVFLGFLPAPVQMHLENELGVRATRMTLLSCVLVMTTLGICIYAQVDARMRRAESPVPGLLWPILGLLAFEVVIRFFVVMSQGRPMGSILGSIAYAIYRPLSGKRDQLPSASGGRGYSVAFTPPAEDVIVRDALTLKEPLLTLLTSAEQKRLAERVGFDYRRTASGVAWVILVAAALGAYTSTTPLGMFVAAAVAIEQALRLVKLRREPVGSIFGLLVRPFVRSLLLR